MPRSPHGFVALACVVVLSLSGPARADPIVVSGTGADANALLPTLTAFRNLLGGANNLNTVGSVGSGRREINWDGGGAATTVSPTPFDTFNTAVPRGAVFTTSTATPATAFVQAPPSGLASAAVFNNGTYSTFPVNSQQRLFSAIGSNVTNAAFFIPGTNTPASVSGFGAVFSDVDLPNSTSIQFFDPLGTPLGFPVFAQPLNNGLSFVGVFFNAGEQIGFARITSGNAVPGPNANDGGATDIVFMDDFIFGEPRAVSAVPEPATLGLLAGLVVVAFVRRRNVRPV